MQFRMVKVVIERLQFAVYDKYGKDYFALRREPTRFLELASCE